MVDFLEISTELGNKGVLNVSPEFIAGIKPNDLMIKGGDFYAVWNEETGLWSTEEKDAINIIDRELLKYTDKLRHESDAYIKVKLLKHTSNRMIARWHDYVKKDMRDCYHILNQTIVFANDKPNKKDYASIRLDYPLEPGELNGYERLMSTLYSEKERHKIEWAIGAVVTGNSKHIQKFLVLYGSAGTGKSTVLNIIQKLFKGYCGIFDAKALGSASDQFALESFKNHPLVAIQHDGDLSRIEDNTRLNSLVSHEEQMMNVKHEKRYSSAFNAFLFMGTNKPVKITDAKSGLIRRLIDVSPTGNKLSSADYNAAMSKIDFELGAIACRCRDVYLKDPHAYDSYVPFNMMEASNALYNFILDYYPEMSDPNGITMTDAWSYYNEYCESANIRYPLEKNVFKEEIKTYYDEFINRGRTVNGARARSLLKGFRKHIFELEAEEPYIEEEKSHTIKFESQHSIFDDMCEDMPAQYGNSKEEPSKKWVNVKTKLKDLNTSELHYVKVPENHIVIDFDIKDDSGQKSFERNLEAASKWPPTYAELSKSGKGIHLHYLYTGDPTRLSSVYDKEIEVKVFTGGSSLRRKLTKCNSLPVANISSGLPLREEKKVVNFETIIHLNGLERRIRKTMNKEYENLQHTKPCIDFIYKLLDDAYNSGLKYDLTKLRNEVFAFAAQSSNNSEYCTKLVGKMKFKSDDPEEPIDYKDDSKIVFFDVEVFPNLLLINWKLEGEDSPIIRMINPEPAEVRKLFKYKLIGFNCRRYDNHILYARGFKCYNNEQLFKLSQSIINNKSDALFRDAYDISYTDIYDFVSKKQSLKKYEIELGLTHKELNYRWDQPVPEDKWYEVAEYCDNDVISTEAVFNARKADFSARLALVRIIDVLYKGKVTATPNDTTNTLTAKLIFGNNKDAQREFNWRDLSKPVPPEAYDEYVVKFGSGYKFRVFDETGFPKFEDFDPSKKYPDGYSILPFFPGYKFENGKSSYLDVDEVGEGGYVYSEPGMYINSETSDVMSMHPYSIINEMLFGPVFTKVFNSIVDLRVAFKHKDLSTITTIFEGVLSEFADSTEEELTNLAAALKIAINAVYGLTAAKFANAFRDIHNIDNIVAKRGALFMVRLRNEVQKRGGHVIHVKTDSIKIVDLEDNARQWIYKFAAEFGYKFEVEAIYDKICLVNNAVYIAYEHETSKKPAHWTATGAEFAVPYVFKTLFTKEPIEFKDLTETKSVSTAMYLDYNENLPEGEHDLHFVGKVGLFCPIAPGKGGAILLRENGDKYDSVTGAKDYRWLEAETVKALNKQDDIDMRYFAKLTDDALASIEKFGDAEWFRSDLPIFHEKPNLLKFDTLPWDFY